MYFKKMVINFFSSCYDFLLPDNLHLCQYLIINTRSRTESHYDDSHESAIFKSEKDMDEFIDENVAKSERYGFLKFKLIGRGD